MLNHLGGAEVPIQTKKTIVVIGKMGHGKSSFVKMLAHPQQKQSIKAEASSTTVTLECSLYRADPSLSLSSQDLFVIDTPGLNSDVAVFLTVDKLVECITLNHCQIVALVYVLNITEREIDLNGNGHIFTFFDQMKLRYSIKKQIMTCVLSHFDEFYTTPKRNQKYFRQYQQKFNHIGIGDVWRRKIQWMSQPQEDHDNYEEIIHNPRHKAHELWINQWKKLKLYFMNHTCQPFNQYLEDLEIFRLRIMQDMGEALNETIGIKTQHFKRQLTVVSEENETGLGVGLGLGGATVGVATAGVVGTCVVVSQAGLITGAVIGGIALGPIGLGILIVAGGATALSLLGFGVKKMFFSKKFEKINQDNAFREEQVQMIQNQIKRYQYIELVQCTKIEDCTIFIENSKWIQDYSASIIKENTQDQELLNFVACEDGKKVSIPYSGKLTLNYTVKTPTVEAYEKFSKQVTSVVYGGL